MLKTIALIGLFYYASVAVLLGVFLPELFRPSLCPIACALNMLVSSVTK